MDGASDRIYDELQSWYSWYGITSDDVSVVHEYVVGDDFWGNLSEFQYFLGPNIPLDNLSGCQFLVSTCMESLLNIDLCSTDTTDFLSLRMLCADSCDCSSLPLN